MIHRNDTIVALATPPGTGAIGVIRLSGPAAISMADAVFSKSLADKASHTLHFGTVSDAGAVIDEVVIGIFRAPHSYTREDVAEISAHGSAYIISRLINLFIRQGARMAQPGEFTLRAFLNGQLDLSQAEAVADLIASHSQASHRLALQQMRGGFSRELKKLREQLINFASLIELELDFSEEDVEFASRTELEVLVRNIHTVIEKLIRSFEYGNVMKNGVPVVIAGKPNVGKSTLLNRLLNEERAIVSEIPGTTRDTIEDEITLEGIRFRFIDTAGIRKTGDVIEAIGVQRAYEQMRKSSLIIYLFDPAEMNVEELEKISDELKQESGETNAKIVFVGNKADKFSGEELRKRYGDFPAIFISAKENLNMEALTEALLREALPENVMQEDIIVSNVRHAEALRATQEALQAMLGQMKNSLQTDLLAAHIRQALHYLGEITGEITTEDLLENIFSKFCIGK